MRWKGAMLSACWRDGAHADVATLRAFRILGVAAGRFHSACFSATHVYTFGANQGQLGHPKGDEYQVCVCTRWNQLRGL